jgi:hypothetical protein
MSVRLALETPTETVCMLPLRPAGAWFFSPGHSTQAKTAAKGLAEGTIIVVRPMRPRHFAVAMRARREPPLANRLFSSAAFILPSTGAVIPVRPHARTEIERLIVLRARFGPNSTILLTRWEKLNSMSGNFMFW